MKRLIGLLMGVFSLTACATGTTNLTLGLADDAVKPGVISEAPARTLYLAEVTDERDPTRIDRIGNKRNGYGMVMGAVGTNEPVTDTVADTLTKTFEASGHKVVAEQDGAPLRVDAAVKTFWFDYKTGFVTVEFFGDIQIALKVTDTATGAVVFDDIFKGYYSDKTGGGLSKTWTRVMDSALADLSREISLSSDLLMVLEEAEEPAAADAPAEDTVS
jgi:ABC-type uncharacterized transport system auxiliary subunit